MKKLFLSVVIIITTLASCSKGNDDDVVDIETPELQNISFSTRNDTRASETTNNTQDYAVYAQYSTAKANWFMDKLELTHQDVIIDNSIIYYWPANALDFYAYAPLTSVNFKTPIVVNPTGSTKGTVNIDYTVPTKADDESFMVATPLIDQTASASNGKVNFIFSRMLSKINITVSLDKTLTGYTLNVNGPTELSVKSNSGRVDITDAIPKWTTVLTDVTYTTTSNTTPSTVTYFIMPHNTNGYVVTINGVLITKAGEAPIERHLTHTFNENSSVTDFEPGKQYNLNFEINALTHASFSTAIQTWRVNDDTGGII